MGPERRRPLLWLVLVLLVALGLLALRHHVVALTFPYPIAYGEGVIAQWLVDPGPLYPADPDLARHNPYAPAGYLLAGVIHALVGDPFVALRALALLGLVGIAIGLAIGPCAGRPWFERVALVGVVVLAPIAWRYGSLGRFDTAAAACSLLAVCCAARGGRWRWVVLGACLGGAAAAIKPSYLAGLVAVVACAGSWRRGLVAVALGTVIAVVGPVIAAASGEAVGLHLVARQGIGWDPLQTLRLWLRFAGEQPILLAVLAWFLVARRDRRDPWWCFCAAALVLQLASLKTGADRNYQLELLVAAGVAAARLRAGADVGQLALPLRLTLLQLLLYLPIEPAPVFTATYGQEVSALQSAITPGDADREIGAVIADEIEAAEGPILCEDIGYLVRAARPVIWQPYQFEQLRRRGAWSDEPLLEGVAAKRYGLIVVRRDDSWFSPELRQAVADTYALRRQVGPYLLFAPDFSF